MPRTATFAIALLSLAAITGAAHAVPLTWTIQNAQFEDGSLLTGSFDYDATTNTYSNLNVTTETSGVFGQTYNDSPFFSVSGDADFLQISEVPEPLNLLFLSFGEDLTDAGGTIPLAGAGAFEQKDPILGPIEQRFLVSGQVHAVPSPATALLFAPGLLLLAGLRRGRQNK